ncbi:MAG TPA: hypothetical protein PLU58_07370 [Saprospiraceae bacterium]|nr:hypothetical protein [Saprospiraceae bacterium]
MKKYIKISSLGEVDAKAFTLLGASSKRNDTSKIGQWGSGLKYAIAYLLRNNIELKVFSSYKEIKITKKADDFRGEALDIIVVDGVATSLTTGMGFDWKPWYVIREIYCNAIDEGSHDIGIVDTAEPVEDHTVFYFEATDEFKEVLNNWDNYFSSGRKDLVYHDKNANAIFTGGEGLIVYRKGIQCYHSPQRCIFNYDLDQVEINESRTLKSEWDFSYYLHKFLKPITDVGVLSLILRNICNSYEESSLWDDNISLFSDQWIDAIEDRVLVPREMTGFWQEEMLKLHTLILPNSLIKGLKGKFGDKVVIIGESTKSDIHFKAVEINQRQSDMLKKANEFLSISGYVIKAEINVVRFSKPLILGQAKDEKILLSEKAFDMGIKKLVAVMIEEQEHLINGFSDETKDFQNQLINRLITSLEESSKTYL